MAEERVKNLGIGYVLLSSRSDIYYYTGYETPPEERALYLKGRGFLTSGLGNSPRNSVHSLDELFRGMRGKTVLFDETSLKASEMLAIKAKGVRMKPSSAHIHSPRMVKEPAEVRMMRRLARATKDMIGGLDPWGKTENGLLIEMRKTMLDMGIEESFHPIIAAGKNTAIPHHIATGKRISKREPLLIDMGLRDRYCSDITRTFMPSAMKEMLEDVREMQSELIGMAVPGKSFRNLNNLFSMMCKKRGYRMIHSAGHGLGLQVHERPYLDDLFVENMVITIEPGVYKRGIGGCRIEDMVLIKKNRPAVL